MDNLINMIKYGRQLNAALHCRICMIVDCQTELETWDARYKKLIMA